VQRNSTWTRSWPMN